MKVYDCKIIGDGKSIDTAFRPAIRDLVDANGKPLVTYSCISSGAGRMTVVCEGDFIAVAQKVSSLLLQAKLSVGDIVEK